MAYNHVHLTGPDPEGLHTEGLEGGTSNFDKSVLMRFRKSMYTRIREKGIASPVPGQIHACGVKGRSPLYLGKLSQNHAGLFAFHQKMGVIP